MLGRSTVLRGGLALLVAAAALSVPLSVRACSAGASIALVGVDSSVPSDSVVTVAGSSFTGPTRVLWDSPVGQVLATVPDGNSFRVQVTIPTTSDGIHAIYGDDGVGSAAAPSATLTVQNPAPANPPPPTSTGNPTGTSPVGSSPQTTGPAQPGISQPGVQASSGSTIVLTPLGQTAFGSGAAPGDGVAGAGVAPSAPSAATGTRSGVSSAAGGGLFGGIASGFAPSRATQLSSTGLGHSAASGAGASAGIALAIGASVVVILGFAVVPFRRRVASRRTR